MRLAQGVSARHATARDAAAAARHARRLLTEVPAASDAALARVAGVSESTVTLLRAPGHRPSPRTAAAVLGVTPTALAAARGLAPADRAVHLVRTMQAAGWSVAWQGRQLGSDFLPNMLVRHARGAQRWVHATRLAAVEALASQVGDREATPGDGVTTRSIGHAKACARRDGWYPPGCYRDDGTLDPRAVPVARDSRGRVVSGHGWVLADEEAALTLDVLRASVGLDPATSTVLARRLGTNPRRVQRVRARVGLTYDCTANTHLRVTAGAHTAAAAVQVVLDGYDDGGLDPVHACYRLFWLNPDPDRYGHLLTWRVPRDHPGRVAYDAETRAHGRVAA